jgi:DNA primase
LPLLKPGHSLRFVTLPLGEDPDSLIRNSGAPAFGELLRAAKPLAETLWHSELDAKSIATPERRADLEYRLMAHAGTIADRSVQAEYRRFLRDRLFALGRPKNQQNGRRFPRAPATPFAALRGDAPPPPPAPGRRQRELLIGMLLTHTFLIAQRVEEIDALDFPEPELHALKRAIFEAEVDAAGLDATALRLQLGQNGFATTVDAALSALADHAGSLSRVADVGSIVRYCDHVIGMLCSGGEGRRSDAGEDLTTPEAWERYRATKEGEAQEGFSEEEFPPGRAEGVSP